MNRLLNLRTALRHGDLDRLLVPTDSNGLKCGVDSEVQKEPYLVFFDISECAKYDVPLYGCKTPQVCVKECPTEDFTFVSNTCNPTTVADIRSKLICDHSVQKNQLNCNDIQSLIDRRRCARYYLKSVPCKYRLMFNIYDPAQLRFPSTAFLCVASMSCQYHNFELLKHVWQRSTTITNYFQSQSDASRTFRKPNVRTFHQWYCLSTNYPRSPKSPLDPVNNCRPRCGTALVNEGVAVNCWSIAWTNCSPTLHVTSITCCRTLPTIPSSIRFVRRNLTPRVASVLLTSAYVCECFCVWLIRLVVTLLYPLVSSCAFY